MSSRSNSSECYEKGNSVSKNIDIDSDSNECDNESHSHVVSSSINTRRLNKKTNRRIKKTNKIRGKQKYQNKSSHNITNDSSSSYYKNAKEHFLYMPYYPLPDLSDLVGELIEFRIASEFLSQSNKAFIERRIWGSDIYTSDSDPVCILQHSGYFEIKDLPPTDIKGLSLFLRVSKGRSTYNGSFKNEIKSKKLTNYQGHSIKPENFTSLHSLGTYNELLEMASKMPCLSEYERKKPLPIHLADNMYYTEFNMVFNLSYEMWLAYSLPAICDKGQCYKDYTSWKLKYKVLYIETADKRYEISLNVADHNNDDYLFDEFETFNICEVRDPIVKDNDFMLENKIPLSEENVHPMYNKVDWYEFVWSDTALKVRDVLIEGIKCFNYYNTKDK